MSFHVPEKSRVIKGGMGSSEKDGNNGFFLIYAGRQFRVIASDGGNWEHVSVSLDNRCPTWEEMCLIKNVFWDDEDYVVQFHPPKSQYVNVHSFCLHMWRPAGRNFETPPTWMIGPK